MSGQAHMHTYAHTWLCAHTHTFLACSFSRYISVMCSLYLGSILETLSQVAIRALPPVLGHVPCVVCGWTPLF